MKRLAPTPPRPRNPGADASRPGGPAEMNHALEVMRVSATFLVLFYHASLTYLDKPLRLTFWLAYDPSGHRGFDVFAYWVNGFVMPLFFLAAGVSAPAACQARGVGEFLKHRARRLLRPLLFGCLAILPATYVVWGYGLILTGRCDEDQILAWRFLPEVRSNLYGFLHLWYLEYLFLVCALWGAGWLLTRRWFGKNESKEGAVAQPPRWLDSPWRPVVPALGTLLIFLVDSDTMLRVDNSWLPNPARVLHYLLFFSVGAWLSQLSGPKARLIPYSRIYACASFFLFAAMLPWLLRHAETPLTGTDRIVLCILAALFPWLTIFGALGLLLRLVKDRGPKMRFLAESSFWVYLIHVPFVGAMQVLLVPVPWPAAVKFLLVAAVGVGGSLASYEYLVRRSWIGELVNGARKRTAKKGWLGPDFGWIAAVVLVVAASGCGLWSLRSFFFGLNLHEVIAGKVYRSTRLKPVQLDHEMKARGIRTVIALSADVANHPWIEEQRRFCADRGVVFLPLACPARHAPTEADLANLVRSLDEAPRPILIEGQRGIRSVSLASAVARLLAGAAPEDALHEFSLGYGEFTDLDHSPLAASLIAYRDMLAARRLGHTASGFRAWVAERSRKTLPGRAPDGAAAPHAAVAGAPAEQRRLD